MKAVLAILLLAIASGTAHAGDDPIDADRPGIADGSHSLKQGQSQIEVGANLDRDSVTLPTLLRYGLTDSFELRAENDNGSAPFSLGFKDHFLDKGMISAGVIGRWFLEHRSYGDVRLVSDIEAGEHWDINPNMGFAIDREHSKSATAALTLQYNFTPKTNVFIDTGVMRSQVLVDAGGALIIGNATQLDASVTRGAHGGAKTAWSAGVSRRF